MACLRRLSPQDHGPVLAIYRQAVLGLVDSAYGQRQLQAWARQAQPTWCHGLEVQLQQGWGLVSGEPPDAQEPLAFGLLHPPERVALLYCRPDAQRQGHGRNLLAALEERARQQGVERLRTEASAISRGLFLQLGWQDDWQEDLLIDAVPFRRFRLSKPLGLPT